MTRKANVIALECGEAWNARTIEVDRLRVFIEALRVLAQTNDPNRVVLIENAVDEYLKGEPGNVRVSLERLCDAIEREEAEMRRNEDWIIARDYVRSRLRRLA